MRRGVLKAHERQILDGGLPREKQYYQQGGHENAANNNMPTADHICEDVVGHAKQNKVRQTRKIQEELSENNPPKRGMLQIVA